MPDTFPIAVSVAESDARQLKELSASLFTVTPDAEEAPIDVRSLDGDAIAVIVIMLGHQGISLLTKWLVARVQAGKPATVSAHGIRIEANSVADLERIAKLLELNLAAETGKKDGKKDKKHQDGGH